MLQKNKTEQNNSIQNKIPENRTTPQETDYFFYRPASSSNIRTFPRRYNHLPLIESLITSAKIHWRIKTHAVVISSSLFPSTIPGSEVGWGQSQWPIARILAPFNPPFMVFRSAYLLFLTRRIIIIITIIIIVVVIIITIVGSLLRKYKATTLRTGGIAQCFRLFSCSEHEEFVPSFWQLIILSNPNFGKAKQRTRKHGQQHNQAGEEEEGRRWSWRSQERSRDGMLLVLLVCHFLALFF